jgi:hypothetical protein
MEAVGGSGGCFTCALSLCLDRRLPRPWLCLGCPGMGGLTLSEDGMCPCTVPSTGPQGLWPDRSHLNILFHFTLVSLKENEFFGPSSREGGCGEISSWGREEEPSPKWSQESWLQEEEAATDDQSPGLWSHPSALSSVCTEDDLDRYQSGHGRSSTLGSVPAKQEHPGPCVQQTPGL